MYGKKNSKKQKKQQIKIKNITQRKMNYDNNKNALFLSRKLSNKTTIYLVSVTLSAAS